MKIGNFEIIRRKKTPEDKVEERSINFGLGFNGIGGYTNSYAMKLSAVYAAVNQISNSCALLPIQITKNKKGVKVLTDHPMIELLNRRPNPWMNHYNFVKQMMESVMLNGEAFALIERDEDTLNVIALHYIDPANVQVLKDRKGLHYLISGASKAIDSVNMIHLYQHLDMNTFRGISVISYANRTLKAASEAEQHSSNFFKSGANLSGILKSAAPLNNQQKKEIRDSWAGAFSNNQGDVSVAVLPQGIEYQPIAINPTDSKLLESRQYDIIEIARFFNISPIKLFDLTNSSYASAEMAQLSFAQDTIMPYVNMMEEELNRKLFKPSERGKYEVEFDFTALLEADKKTEADYYKTLMVNGLMSLNEVREKLNLQPVSGGDQHFIQLNMTTIDNVLAGFNIKSNLLDNQFKQGDKEDKEPEPDTNPEPGKEEENEKPKNKIKSKTK